MIKNKEETKTPLDSEAKKIVNLQLPKVVWSSFASNMISVFDMQTKQLYKPFKGAQVKAGKCFTFVEHMPDTDILISAHYSWNGFEGNFETFRVGKQVEKIYSLEGFERRGQVGTGDIACNAARKVAALIPVEHIAEYHLFDWTELKIKKIAKYQPIHRGSIESFSFDPEGRNIITIDASGLLVVSDVDTDQLIFSKQLRQREPTYFSRCRWNPVHGNHSIAIKYNRTNITLLNPEKKALISKDTFKFESDPFWIDWRYDGFLLASGGFEGRSKVCDVRNRKIIKSFGQLHSSQVYSARWNKDGNLLATTSDDKTISVVEFRTGKVLYTAKAHDENFAMSICFMDQF